MARKKTTPPTDPNLTAQSTTDQVEILPIPAVSKTAITKARDLALVIVAEVTAITANLVVETEDQYHAADEILHRIKVTGKRLDQPFDEVIKPVRGGLDKVYALRRSIENPLLDLEVAIKEKMRVYKVNENERLRLVEVERARLQRVEEQRVYEEQRAEQNRRIAEAATQNDFQKAAEILATPVTVPEIAIVAPPLPTPIRAASSSATKVKRVRVVDPDLFIHAVSLGLVPGYLLMIDHTALAHVLRDKPDEVALYPGVEVYEDFTISGR